MQEYVVAGVLKVLGHPSRIKILKALEKGHRCVKDLEATVGIKQSNLSQHLRILKDKGILECERRGMEVCYRIKDKRVLDIIACVRKFLTQGG